MSNKYKFRDNEKAYFVSFSVVYWIDVFIRREYKDVIVESLKYCMDNKDLNLHAWCIMTSHIHLIISTRGKKLEDIMRDLKSYTSTKLKEVIRANPQESRKEWMLWLMERAGKKNSNNNEFQYWQQDNHPIELSNALITKQKLDYLHNNPVEAGFVNEPEDYVYSSASYYVNNTGLIMVQML